MVTKVFKYKKNQKIILLVAVTVLLGFFLFLGNKQSDSFSSNEIFSGEVTITFDKSGFSPSQVNITKGSTITFINNSEGDFWPASNLHPTHNIYSEFDSLEAFPAGSSWSFNFKNIGFWKYHDHLHSSFGGIINVVLDKNSIISALEIDCDNTDGLDESRRAFCFEEYIRKVSSENGVKEALEALAQGFQTDSLFARNCHALSHIIGEEAYLKFAAGKDFSADNKTTYCGYGFYHGFMESLLTLENDLDKARDFCLYIDQRVMGGRGNAQLACYHGIGHGFVDGAEKRAWGDERALTEPALKLCDKIAETPNEEYRCYSGVFNSLSIAYSSNLYGLELNEKDPLWICREQKEERYKLGCYTDMMVALMTLEDNDLLEASKYISTIEEPYINQSMSTLSSLSVRQRLKAENFDDIIEICHSLDKKLQLQCIKGFSGGLMEFGEPQKEYVRGGVFCSSNGLSKEESIECYQSIIDYASFSYPKDRLESACDIIPIEFKSERVERHCAK